MLKLDIYLIELINQVNKTSIIVDAARYIEELKQKVVKLNQEIAHAQSAVKQATMPMVYMYKLYIYLDVLIF